MENAKNSANEKNIPNDKFEDLLHEILDIVNSLKYPWTSSKTKSVVSRTSLVNTLFGNLQNSGKSTVPKINKDGHFLQNRDLHNCMITLCTIDKLGIDIPGLIAINKSFSKESEDDIEEDSSDYIKDLSGIPDIQYAEFINTSYNKMMDKYYPNDDYSGDIGESENILRKRISSLYTKYTPYPWITLDNSESEDSIQPLFQKLIYLLISVGLHMNNISKTKATSSYIKTPLPTGFQEFLSNNERFVFYGPPSCGKTAFLKNYALEYNTSVFYIDASMSFGSYEDECEFILQTLRPDYTFWKDVPDNLKTAFRNPFEGLNPSAVLKELSPEDIIIFDNISSQEEIDHYTKLLPCYLIFVTSRKELCKGNDFYDFCDSNCENYNIILERLLTKQSDANLPDGVDSNLIAKICYNLDYNLYVYRLVALNYAVVVKTNSKEEGTDFLNLIASSLDIEVFNSLIKKYAHYGLSMQYKPGKSTKRYLRDYIEFLYSSYLTEEQQRILHLLYHCQILSDGKIPIYNFAQYFDSKMLFAFLDELVKLGWITEEKDKLPLVIAASLNNVSTFTGKSYTVYLDLFTHYSFVLKGFSTRRIEEETCIIIIKALHKDYENYVKRCGQRASKNSKKHFSRYLEEMSPEEEAIFRETGILKNDTGDSINRQQFLDWRIISIFYINSILFCLQYNNFELAVELYQYASDPEKISFFTKDSINWMDWHLHLEILTNSIPGFRDNSLVLLDLLNQFANFHPKRKNEIDKLDFDNNNIVLTMYHKTLFEFQRYALQLWENTMTKLNSGHDPIIVDRRDCHSPFLLFKCYKLAFNLEYRMDIPGSNAEYLFLHDTFCVFDRMSKALCGEQLDVDFPEWNITVPKNDKFCSCSLYYQYYILYYSMRVYYYAFVNYNAQYIFDSQVEIKKMEKKEQICNLPTYISHIKDYALMLPIT